MSVNQLKAGAALSYIAIGLNNIVGLLYTPFMLRMLGQNEFGLYSLVASIVSYLTVLDLGFSNAIVRYTAKFRAEGKVREQHEMFGMFFMLYCVIGVLAFLIGLGLYYNVDTLFDATMTAADLRKVRIMMLLMAFNVAFTFPMSIWWGITTAYENFIFQKLINIARIILNPIVMILLLCMGYKAVAMVVVTTLFNVATLCINAWYCKRRLGIKVRFGRIKLGFLREVTVYSFWIFLNGIMDRIYWSTGQFVLGVYAGATAVAVYAVSIQLQHIYTSFSTAISGIFLPKVTAIVTTRNDEKAISNLFIRIGRIQYIILAFVLTGFILFGREFINLWAGEGYEEVYAITLLFFIPLTVPLIQNLGITVLQARNQMKFRSVLHVIIAPCSLAISIPLAKVYEGVGCAIGTATALVAGQIVAMNIYYYKKIHINIPLFWKNIASMSVSPICIGLVSYWILSGIHLGSATQLIAAIAVFSAVYIPVFWVTGMNKYERRLFGSLLLKIYKRIARR